MLEFETDLIGKTFGQCSTATVYIIDKSLIF